MYTKKFLKFKILPKKMSIIFKRLLKQYPIRVAFCSKILHKKI